MKTQVSDKTVFSLVALIVVAVYVAGFWWVGPEEEKPIPETEAQADPVPQTLNRLLKEKIPPPGNPEHVHAYSGSDGAGIFLLRNPGVKQEYELYDSKAPEKLIGWAYFDPASDSWVVSVKEYRIGIKN